MDKQILQHTSKTKFLLVIVTCVTQRPNTVYLEASQDTKVTADYSLVKASEQPVRWAMRQAQTTGIHV